jgi:hypothetical protein
MKKQVLAVLLAAAAPLAGHAQGGPPAGAPQAQQGPGQAQGPGGPKFDPARMEKRMRLARTLGLAEALDLDAPAALKLGDTIGKFDDRRVAARKQMREAGEVLRRAAQGEKVSAADVDGAIQKGLEARAQLGAIDRETVAAVTQGLTPEKKARAVLFLAKFQRRFHGHGPGMGHGGPGMMGPGMMGPGGGMRGHDPRGGARGPGGGPGGSWGMGPADDGTMLGMASPPPGGDFFDDEPED